MKSLSLGILRSALVSLTLISVTQPAFTHTRFETSTVSEGTRMLNNVAISHACHAGTNVIGTSVVFPDGEDSRITVDGINYEGPLTDFISNWGPNVQPLFSRAAFDYVDEKNDAEGNVVGFWAGGGPGMPNHMLAYVPFRVNATNFEPLSCAVSARFYASIVDVCRITGASELHEEGIASFWTHNDLGTPYDRVSENDDGPAPLTFTRNLESNPLPESCGEGDTVEIRPSADQIMRDMPIIFDGIQLWPRE